MPVDSIEACIRNAFKDYTHSEKRYPNCSTPWNEDILRLGNSTNQDLKSCDQTEKKTQFYYDFKFFKHVIAAENKNGKCKGILCNYSTFHRFTNFCAFRAKYNFNTTRPFFRILYHQFI